MTPNNLRRTAKILEPSRILTHYPQGWLSGSPTGQRQRVSLGREVRAPTGVPARTSIAIGGVSS